MKVLVSQFCRKCVKWKNYFFVTLNKIFFVSLVMSENFFKFNNHIRVLVLAQEKNVLLTKIKSLEKETISRPYRGPERDKVHDELRSKLKAAESLCESLMDENEDMKKEIRQLEEEIYELQDNFRYYIFLRYKRYH